MPQIASPIIKQRAAELRTLVLSRYSGWLAGQIGTLQSVLIEKSGRNGHAENFAMVELDTNIEAGTIVAARITGKKANALQGTIES